MNKFTNKIKKKTEAFKIKHSQGLFQNEDGAIDLASIMVGIIVIGLIGGIIAATVFTVIPWSQDNAAKQQLTAVISAENAYKGLSSAVSPPLPTGYKPNSFANSSELDAASLLKPGATYCVTTSPDGKTYDAYAQSATGKTWSVSADNSKPVLYTGTLPNDCQFILPADAPYIDATPQRTVLTYRCDTDVTNGATPLSFDLVGTETWSDGLTNTYANSANKAYNPTPRNFTAGVTYTMTFEGTFKRMRTDSYGATGNLAKCLRSVEHIGSETGLANMYSAFGGSSNLTAVPTHIPATVTNLGSAFSGATNFNDPNISKWDVSNVTDMSSLFQNTKEFNQNINSWNVSKVTNMNQMFSFAAKFNQPLDKWNTSALINAGSMFMTASEFNQNINNWDVSNVTNMSYTFTQASKFNQPLNSWNTSKVTTMFMMFNNTSVFNQNINDWDVSNVTTMNSMFNGSSLYNQPLDKWNTTKVTDMDSMFNNAYKFNQPLNTWNTANVTKMGYMFSRAFDYNNPLDKWNTAKVTDMTGMFAYTAMNNNLSGWDTTALTAGTNFAPSTFPTAYLPAKTTKAP